MPKILKRSNNDLEIPRKLSAILFVDIKGSSLLMYKDEVSTLKNLIELRVSVVEPLTKSFGGRIIKELGDGYLIEFSSIVRALKCALEWQQLETPFTFRMGLHLGDIMLWGGDIFGEAVIVASRLESLADPGGICISRIALEHTRGKIKVPYKDIGDQDLRNIPKPVGACKISRRGARTLHDAGHSPGV